MKLNFNTSACIGKIAARGKISNDEAMQILQEVADRGEKMRRTGEVDPFVVAAKEMAEKLLNEAQGRSTRSIHDAAAVGAGIAKVQAQPPQDAALHTRAILVSENGANKECAANMSAGLKMTLQGVLKSDLRQAGLLDYSRSEGALKDIATAMWDIRHESQPKPNDPAYETARHIIRTMNTVLGRLNSEGAEIERAIDYIFHTSHEIEKMRWGGRNRPATPDWDQAFRQWWSDTRPLLNDDRTFADVTPKAGETTEQAQTRFGDKAFRALVTGLHESEKKPGASWLSEGRVLFFKDAPSWTQYIQTYGKQLNALEMAMDSISSGANAVGVMHFIGHDPERNMKKITDGVEKWLKDNHPDLRRQYVSDLQQDITKLRPGLNELMYHVGAIPRNITNDFRYKLYDGLLKITNMATLGNVAWTHAASLPTTFYLAGKGLGMNSFQVLGGLAKAMLRHSDDQVKWLSENGAYFDGLRPVNEYDNGGTIPGFISSAHDFYMTATGIRYVMRHAKAGFIEMLAHHLNNQSINAFTDLHPNLQSTLSSFGIDAAKWDIIRNAPKTQGPGGRFYISPHTILELPDSAFPGIADLAAYRQNTADQLMMFYSRMADLSTVTPGPRELAMLRGRGERGIASLFTQFAAWPLAAQHQLMAKTFYESATKGKAVATLFVAAGLSMLAGYARTSIRDLAAGNPPEEPKNGADAAFLGLRSMAAGGVLGVLGDHLVGQIGQAVQNQQSFTLGGPVISDIETLANVGYKLAHSLASGQKYDPWPELTHFAVQNVPFANLFYLKGALDYLLFYHLFEAAQPGWWARTNAARMRRGEGTYAGYFPGAPIPYNPFTPEIGLINRIMPREGFARPGATPAIIGTRG